LRRSEEVEAAHPKDPALPHFARAGPPLIPAKSVHMAEQRGDCHFQQRALPQATCTRWCGPSDPVLSFISSSSPSNSKTRRMKTETSGAARLLFHFAPRSYFHSRILSSWPPPPWVQRPLDPPKEKPSPRPPPVPSPLPARPTPMGFLRGAFKQSPPESFRRPVRPRLFIGTVRWTSKNPPADFTGIPFRFSRPWAINRYKSNGTDGGQTPVSPPDRSARAIANPRHHADLALPLGQRRCAPRV